VVARRAHLIVLLVLIIGAVLGWWWSESSGRHPRVLLIGIDGADPTIIDRLTG